MGAGVGLIAALYGGNWLYQANYEAPLAERRAETDSLREDIAKRELDLARFRKASQELKQWRAQSLPSDTEVARSLYQAWLVELVGAAELVNPNVDSSEPSTRKGMYDSLNFSVRGRGTLEQLTQFLFGMLLLMLTGCATVPFPDTDLTSTTPRTAAELSASLWNYGVGNLLIRQSALFELEGMKIPITGVMKLDLSAKVARLVGMNDMGVKLYDISVDKVSNRANFIVPNLASYPGFAEAVAVSVRRIFLAPEPAQGDTLVRTHDTYLLSRNNSSGGTIRFTLGGADTQLLEKTFRGADESWRVRYYQYQQNQGQLFPGGIVLDDDRAGYRLTLWIESVEKTDE